MISDNPIKILPSFALYTFWQIIGIHDYNYSVYYRKIQRYIFCLAP